MGVPVWCLTAGKKLPCAQPQLFRVTENAAFLFILLFLTNEEFQLHTQLEKGPWHHPALVLMAEKQGLGGKTILRIPSQLTPKAESLQCITKKLSLPNFQGGLQILKDGGYFLPQGIFNHCLAALLPQRPSAFEEQEFEIAPGQRCCRFFFFQFPLIIVCLWYVLCCSAAITVPKDTNEQVVIV